jgi:cell division FtsZ-interacting protein ZapD
MTTVDEGGDDGQWKPLIPRVSPGCQSRFPRVGVCACVLFPALFVWLHLPPRDCKCLTIRKEQRCDAPALRCLTPSADN